MLKKPTQKYHAKPIISFDENFLAFLNVFLAFFILQTEFTELHDSRIAERELNDSVNSCSQDKIVEVYLAEKRV